MPFQYRVVKSRIQQSTGEMRRRRRRLAHAMRRYVYNNTIKQKAKANGSNKLIKSDLTIVKKLILERTKKLLENARTKNYG